MGISAVGLTNIIPKKFFSTSNGPVVSEHMFKMRNVTDHDERAYIGCRDGKSHLAFEHVSLKGIYFLNTFRFFPNS